MAFQTFDQGLMIDISFCFTDFFLIFRSTDQKPDVGLFSLKQVIKQGRLSNSNNYYSPFENTLLIRLLRNSLNGSALTLLFGCISTDNVAETKDTLYFAKDVANLRFPDPVLNVSQVNNEFPNEEEELSYINRSLKNNPVPPPMMMPDLINPDPTRLNYMLQIQMQQKMLYDYMLINQLYQQPLPHVPPTGSPLSISSPFIPISSPPSASGGSTGKSNL